MIFCIYQFGNVYYEYGNDLKRVISR